jgi:FkbM family methyltransferase
LINKFKTIFKAKIAFNKEDEKLLKILGVFQYFYFKLFSILGIRNIKLYFFKKFHLSVRLNEKSDLITCVDTFNEKYHHLYIPQNIDNNLSVKVILDFGSNIGTSIILYRHYFPNATILGVEMEKTNFELCKRNVEGLSNVYIENLAIWSIDDSVLGFDKINDANAFHINEKSSNINGQIKSITVEKLFQKYSLNHVDLVKIDIEGAEKNIFFEGSLGWLNQVDYIILEFHDFCDAEFKRLIEILESYHFQVKRQEDFWGNTSERGNLIGIKKKVFLD